MTFTALAGLFYMLLALWMPVHEVRRARRSGGAARWTTIRRLLGLAAVVVALLVGQFWLVHLVAASGSVPFGLLPAAGLASVILLATLLLLLHCWRRYRIARVRRRDLATDRAPGPTRAVPPRARTT